MTSQFVGYWYDLRLPHSDPDAVPGIVWRPGMQVTARVRASGSEAQAAAAVPATAVLYHEGRPLVYVRTSPETFQRREVRLLGREGHRWIVALRQGDQLDGLLPEESVVSRQAQVLLSREFLVGTADND
jgi:multidrug efflux pump subunit AcrA (membrane-fusion protein)